MPKCVCCCGDNRLCQTSTLLQSCCITDLYVMVYHLKQAHNAIFCFRCVFFVDLPKSVRVGSVSCLLLQCIDGMYSFYLSVMCCKMSSWLVPLKGARISLFIHIRFNICIRIFPQQVPVFYACGDWGYTLATVWLGPDAQQADRKLSSSGRL